MFYILNMYKKVRPNVKVVPSFFPVFIFIWISCCRGTWIIWKKIRWDENPQIIAHFSGRWFFQSEAVFRQISISIGAQLFLYWNLNTTKWHFFWEFIIHFLVWSQKFSIFKKNANHTLAVKAINLIICKKKYLLLRGVRAAFFCCEKVFISFQKSNNSHKYIFLIR